VGAAQPEDEAAEEERVRRRGEDEIRAVLEREDEAAAADGEQRLEAEHRDAGGDRAGENQERHREREEEVDQRQRRRGLSARELDERVGADHHRDADLNVEERRGGADEERAALRARRRRREAEARRD